MSRGPSVRLATDSDAGVWNAFLDGRPLSSPLARYEWRRTLQSAYGLETLFLMAERDGATAGLLAAYVAAGGRPPRIHALRGGFVAADSEAAGALLLRLEDERQRRRLGSPTVSSGLQPIETRWPLRRQKTVLLRLDADEETAWRRLRDKSRNMVRKGQRGGFSVACEPAGMAEFHAIYADALLRRGVPVHRRAFFDAMAASLGGFSELLMLRHQGRAVAGMLVVFGRDIAVYPYQAVAEAFRNTGAIQLLNWEAMRRCIARGKGVLDMGESREGGPVYASKINFGGEPHDLYYYEPAAIAPSAAPAASRSVRARVDELLMRRAPLWLRRPYAERKLRRGRVV